MKYISSKNTVKQKLFASFLWAIAVPMLLFSVSISSYLLIEERDKKIAQLIHLSESITELLNSEFDRIDEFVSGLSVTNIIEKMMYSQNSLFDYSRFDPIEIRNYNQQLFVGTTLNPFLLGMDLVLNEKNVVLSNGIYISTLNEYLETTFDLRESKYTELREHIGLFNEGTILFPIKQFNNNRDMALYVKTIPGKGDSVVRATIICTLNVAYVINSINQLNNENYIQVLLLHSNTLLSGDDMLWFGLRKHQFQAPEETGNEELQGHLAWHLPHDEAKGDPAESNRIQRVRINAANYTLVTNTADGIKIVVLAKNRDYLQKVYVVIISSLLFLMVIVSSAYIFAKLITKKNYRPLRTLIGILEKPEECNSEIEEMEDEYTSIYHSYKEMLKVRKNQSMTIYKQQMAMLEYCWQVMLERTHEVNDGILDKIEEFYPISSFKLHFCAVVTNGKHLETANALALMLSDIEDALCNIVHYSKFTCLVTHTTDDITRENVFRKISEYFEKNSMSDSSCGVGRSYQEVRKINRSYNEAMLIVNYRISRKDKRVFFRRDYEQLMSNFYFTISQETRLGNFLRNGDYDSAIGIISELLEINMSMNSISPKAIQNLFFAIYLTGIRICGEIGLDIEQNREPGELLQTNLIDEISEVVYSYLRELCRVIQHESCENHDSADKIKMFITKNITNPNLSMQLVSDHIGRSIAYTSRIFNKIYSMSFIEYINRNRIDIAARLIKESEMPLKEISRSVGFSSDISFRRSFTRYKGVNAGKYRKLV